VIFVAGTVSTQAADRRYATDGLTRNNTTLTLSGANTSAVPSPTGPSTSATTTPAPGDPPNTGSAAHENAKAFHDKCENG
jgi:hypothetical protein